MNKGTKKVLALALCTVAASSMVLSGCSNESTPITPTPTAPEGDTGSSSASTDLIDILTTTKKDAVVYEDTEHEYGYQLEKPAIDEEIAIMHTNYGDIYMRFFPEAAPKTVENFLTHAKDGYYDGITFHRVINDFMIQGGDPTATGSGGESIWGGAFEDEFSDHLFNLRGSVAMANSGKDTNGSQFFINQADANAFAAGESWAEREAYWRDSMWPALSSYYGTDEYEGFITGVYSSGLTDIDLIPQEVRDLYDENGGNVTLDGAFNAVDKGHTVFAQVFEGMDIVDKIAAVETDSATNKPLEDVIIESIEITTYKG